MVCGGLYLLGLDLTVLNVAIPDLEADLQPSAAQLHWIVDGYALVLGGTVLAVGTLTDRVGRRLSFVTGLLLCAAASAAGALGHAPWHVIVSRFCMGAGASLMMPATLSIIRNLFTAAEERRRAIALWTAVAGAGGLTGPVVGGWFVEQSSWRSVFWLNIPLALVLAVLTLCLVPESRDHVRERLDLRGALLSAAGLLALVWAVIEGPTRGWDSPVVLSAFALAGALLAAWVRQQHRCAEPLLPPAVLRDPRVAVGAAALALMSFALFGALFVMTLYLQGVLDCTPWQAGIRTVPLPAALAVGAFAAQPLIVRWGERGTVVTGLVVVTASLVVLAGTDTGSGYGHLLVVQTVAGLGAGMTASAGTEAVMGAVEAERAGLGSAVNDASRQVGSALGVAVQGSLLSTVYTDRIREALAGPSVPARVVAAAGDSIVAAAGLAARLPAADGAALRRLAEDAFVSGLTRAALVAAVATAGAAAAAWRWFPAHRPSPRRSTAPDSPARPAHEPGAAR